MTVHTSLEVSPQAKVLTDSLCATSFQWSNLKDVVSPRSTREAITPSITTTLDSVLHFSEPSKIMFATMFPALTGLSLNDVIAMSTMYIKTNAMAIASAAAADTVASDPSSIVDRSTVARHAASATKMGLSTFLKAQLVNLSHLSLQPLQHEDMKTIDSTLPSAATKWKSLVRGSSIVLPESFRPSPLHCRRTDPPRAEQLALEQLIKKDIDLGRSCALPQSLFFRLAYAETLPQNFIPVDIAHKADTPKGRLVVDATRGGLNSEEKKKQLADTWGSISFPTVPDYCQLFLDVQAHFHEPLAAFKIDKEAWYRRIRLTNESSTLQVFSAFLDDIPHVVIPLAQQFGVQDSNYQSYFAGNVMETISITRQLSTHGIRISRLYSDDEAGFLPPRLIPSEIEQATIEATRLAGRDIIQPSKLETGLSLDIIGFRFDCEKKVVSLSQRTLLKLYCLLFHEIPEEISTDTMMTITFLQRLSSYMIRTADIVCFLRPFSRSAAHNTAGRTHPVVHMLPSLLTDIWIWRAVFATAVGNNVSWMTIPIHLPPLLAHSHSDSDATRANRALRQAEAAAVVAHADSNLTGIGFIAEQQETLHSWAKFPIPPLLFDLSFDDLPAKASINICEFFAVVVMLSLLAPIFAGTIDNPTHIHIWTDNTSCLAWMTKYRAKHPLILFLLQLFSHVQAKYHIIVTSAHIKGELNTLADAASRNFECPNGDRSFQILSPIFKHPSLPAWVTSLLPSVILQSEITWTQVQSTLTSLE